MQDAKNNFPLEGNSQNIKYCTDIFPYQQYLSYYRPDFDQTLKQSFWINNNNNSNNYNKRTNNQKQQQQQQQQPTFEQIFAERYLRSLKIYKEFHVWIFRAEYFLPILLHL